jgi:bacterioferritin-associated ferredoxin
MEHRTKMRVNGTEEPRKLFNQDIFKVVVQEIADTREVEIGCNECFEQLDRFVEMKLSGLDAAQSIPLVQEHLELCGECREEFEALLTALRATGEA